MKKEEIEGFSEETKRDYSKERMDRCLPLAQKILEIIAESKPKMGDKKPELQEEWDLCYNEIGEKILNLMVENNLCYYSDKEFVMRLVIQPFEMIEHVLMNTWTEQSGRILEKKFGKDFYDITFEDVDKVLKS